MSPHTAIPAYVPHSEGAAPTPRCHVPHAPSRRLFPPMRTGGKPSAPLARASLQSTGVLLGRMEALARGGERDAVAAVPLPAHAAREVRARARVGTHSCSHCRMSKYVMPGGAATELPTHFSATPDVHWWSRDAGALCPSVSTHPVLSLLRWRGPKVGLHTCTHYCDGGLPK